MSAAPTKRLIIMRLHGKPCLWEKAPALLIVIYIKFFSLKSAIDGSLVDSATLKMYETADSNANNTVDAFRVTENWDATTVTWNKQPTTTSSRFGSCVTGGTDKNSCSINATIFARWVANGNSNYGMVLKGNNESLQRFVKFYGSRTTSTSYRPKLSVVYYSKGDFSWNLIVTK